MTSYLLKAQLETLVCVRNNNSVLLWGSTHSKSQFLNPCAAKHLKNISSMIANFLAGSPDQFSKKGQTDCQKLKPNFFFY